MTINIELIRAVADWIEAHPDHFDMGAWQVVPDDTAEDDEFANLEVACVEDAMGAAAIESWCGTTCCVAGVAVAIALDRKLPLRGDMIAEAGRLLLGFDDVEAAAVFHGHVHNPALRDPDEMVAYLRGIADARSAQPAVAAWRALRERRAVQ